MTGVALESAVESSLISTPARGPIVFLRNEAIRSSTVARCEKKAVTGSELNIRIDPVARTRVFQLNNIRL